MRCARPRLRRPPVAPAVAEAEPVRRFHLRGNYKTTDDEVSPAVPQILAGASQPRIEKGSA